MENTSNKPQNLNKDISLVYDVLESFINNKKIDPNICFEAAMYQYSIMNSPCYFNSSGSSIYSDDKYFHDILFWALGNYIQTNEIEVLEKIKEDNKNCMEKFDEYFEDEIGNCYEQK